MLTEHLLKRNMQGHQVNQMDVLNHLKEVLLLYILKKHQQILNYSNQFQKMDITINIINTSI